MAIFIVIWIIMILSMVALVAIKLVYSEARQNVSRIHGIRARQMADMGIAIGANPQISRDDPLLAQQEEGRNDGYEVTLSSEAAKFNINYLIIQKDDELLRDIFIEWGLDFEEANKLIACLYDWVDDNDEVSLNGAEKNEYERLGFKGFPYNRPFYSLDELRYVIGWDKVESTFPQWKDWFTIWSAGKLDLNEAESELLAIACKVDVDNVRRIREEVVGEDGILGTSDDQLKSSVEEVLNSLGIPAMDREKIANRLTTKDTTTRIESIGRSGEQKRKVVVIIGNRTGIPSLLDRYEEEIYE